MLKKVFNWSEVHLSEVTSYKIHTLVVIENWMHKVNSVQEVDFTNLHRFKSFDYSHQIIIKTRPN